MEQTKSTRATFTITKSFVQDVSEQHFCSFKKWELISRINQSLFVLADLESDQIMSEGADRPCKLYSTTISNHITKKSYAIGENEIYAYIRT